MRVLLQRMNEDHKHFHLLQTVEHAIFFFYLKAPFLPIVVITVPAKKKEELRSQRLVWLDTFPDGFTPARTAETSCCKREIKKRKQINAVSLSMGLM